MLSHDHVYVEVADLFRDAHTEDGAMALLDFVASRWPEIASREPTPEDAEVCRLAMLSAVHAQDFPQSRLWRARALARFSALGWHEGTASILMGIAFEELARANDDYALGKTLDKIQSSDVALGIWDELERFTFGAESGFALGPGSPTQAVVRRFFYEKRGFLLLLSEDYASAREMYGRALQSAAGNIRGEVKVKLGLGLVDYLAAGGLANADAAEATAALGESAAASGHRDLADIAEANSKVMRAGGHELQAYEIL